MGFSTGAKNTGDILVDIINGLVSSGVWHNVDTTWTFTNRTGNNAKRIFAYGTTGTVGRGNSILESSITANTKIIPVANITNFAVNDKIVIGTGDTSEVRIISLITPGVSPAGTLTVEANINTARDIGDPVKALDFEIYMAIELINTSTDFYYGNQGWWYRGKGMRFVFTLVWDAVAHTYSTSNQSTFVPFEMCGNCAVSADLTTTMVTYWLWIEDTPGSVGNGFVIMGKPEPTGDNNQQSFIIVLERNPVKEYTDGYTNFYMFSSINQWQHCLYDGNWPTTMWRNRCLLRPFVYQYPDHGSWGGYSVNGNGLSFIPTPSYYGFKSNGDNKVYYVKPLIHNHAGQTIPIFQSNLFFMWNEVLGIIDGDIIAIEGQTTKFLCKSLDSPDNGSRITFAMKYTS